VKEKYDSCIFAYALIDSVCRM